MMEQAKEILRKQKRLLASIVIAICFVFLGLAYFITEDSSSLNTSLTQKAIALPGDKVNAQEMWMHQVESQNQALENQNKLLEQKFKYLESILLDQKKKEEVVEQEKVDLKQEIGRLKQELVYLSEKAAQKIESPKEIVFFPSNERETVRTSNHLEVKESLNFSPLSDPFIPLTNENPAVEYCNHEVPRLNEAIMQMSETNQRNKTTHVDDKIFAGTTVKALLVSSVDAVCGVFANSDPIPVKLRILDDGHLPKGVEARLKGGLIIGSAYGNISSERVYIRLERMSLIDANGRGIEMEVAGYVSGEDGRSGLRGIVVDRSSKIVKNAAYSGFLSGTGQVLQSAVSKRPVDCWNNYAVGTDILKQGCSSGAGNAFDMLADYYIRRAEQVQPVLQVNAGRIVDITFTFGASLGDLNTKEKIKETRLRSRQR